jgi:protein-disulfide isomerase
MPTRSSDAGISAVALLLPVLLAQGPADRTATPFMGLQPGVSTRPQVEGALGRGLNVSEALVEYTPTTIVNVSRVLVQYRPNGGVIDRLEVYFAAPQSRDFVVKALKLGNPTASAVNPRLREFHGSSMLVLNYVGAAAASGVTSVGYYSAQAFDELSARAGARPVAGVVAERAAGAPSPAASMPGPAAPRPAASSTSAAPRFNVSGPGRPARGGRNAAVEIVAFTNFECPFCRKAAPTIRQVLDAYGERVRFVYRHFPLDRFVGSDRAAEAAECAGEQGKFWPYHDWLYAYGESEYPSDLTRAASAAGLDMTRFGSCVSDRRFQATVASDLAAGRAAGVNATPTFFINGRPLAGAQPFAAFKQMIDEELALRR